MALSHCDLADCRGPAGFMENVTFILSRSGPHRGVADPVYGAAQSLAVFGVGSQQPHDFGLYSWRHILCDIDPIRWQLQFPAAAERGEQCRSVDRLAAAPIFVFRDGASLRVLADFVQGALCRAVPISLVESTRSHCFAPIQWAFVGLSGHSDIGGAPPVV